MSENLPARRVVIIVTARDGDDPLGILAAVSDGLRNEQQLPAVLVPKIAETTPLVKDESLETKSRELAASVLDKEAARNREEALKTELKSEDMVQAIVAQRKGAREYREYLKMRAIRICVDLLETVAGHGKAIVNTVMGLFGRGEDE